MLIRVCVIIAFVNRKQNSVYLHRSKFESQNNRKQCRIYAIWKFATLKAN